MCNEIQDCHGKNSTEVSYRRGRRCKLLLYDLKEGRGYWKLKEELLDLTVWRTRFGRQKTQ